MTVATPSVRDTITDRLGKLTEEQFTAAASYLEAVIEAAQTDHLDEVHINDFRKSFELKPLFKPALTQLIGVVLPPKNKPLDDRISEGGYDWHDNDITAENFPVTSDAGPQPLYLAHFGVVVSCEAVEEWAKANGFAVANNDDLLAVGASEQYKDLQREFPIVQLGSSVVLDGEHNVSYLYSFNAERRLYLRCYSRDMRDECRFLLRKLPESLDSQSLGT